LGVGEFVVGDKFGTNVVVGTSSDGTKTDSSSPSVIFVAVVEVTGDGGFVLTVRPNVGTFVFASVGRFVGFAALLAREGASLLKEEEALIVGENVVTFHVVD
jgi:hypothetical protein